MGTLSPQHSVRGQPRPPFRPLLSAPQASYWTDEVRPAFHILFVRPAGRPRAGDCLALSTDFGGTASALVPVRRRVLDVLVDGAESSCSVQGLGLRADAGAPSRRRSNCWSWACCPWHPARWAATATRRPEPRRRAGEGGRRPSGGHPHDADLPPRPDDALLRPREVVPVGPGSVPVRPRGRRRLPGRLSGIRSPGGPLRRVAAYEPQPVRA